MSMRLKANQKLIVNADQPQITSYFTKTKPITNEIIETPKKNTENVMQFYDVAVDSNAVSTNICTNDLCLIERTKLNKTLADIKSEIMRINKALAVATNICNEKDEKIRRLQQQINESSGNVESIVNIQSNQNKHTQMMSFANFFTEKQIKAIESIGLSTLEDSSFVLNVVRSLYSTNLHKLQNVSISGRSKDGKKMKMSPEKSRIIKDMFSCRMQKVDELERATREKKLNILINRAITNLNQHKKNRHQKKLNELYKQNEMKRIQ